MEMDRAQLDGLHMIHPLVFSATPVLEAYLCLSSWTPSPQQ